MVAGRQKERETAEISSKQRRKRECNDLIFSISLSPSSLSLCLSAPPLSWLFSRFGPPTVNQLAINAGVSLKKADFRECRLMTDTFISAFAAHCPALEVC